MLTMAAHPTLLNNSYASPTPWPSKQASTSKTAKPGMHVPPLNTPGTTSKHISRLPNAYYATKCAQPNKPASTATLPNIHNHPPPNHQQNIKKPSASSAAADCELLTKLATSVAAINHHISKLNHHSTQPPPLVQTDTDSTTTSTAQEGIQLVADLADLEKQSLQQLADNLRKPGGRITHPDPNAQLGATIPTPAFTYGSKSQKRLTVACDLIRFYQTVGRDLTAANIQWNQVMSNFEIQWKALKDRKDEDDPDVPKITKALPIIKWTEAFQDFLNRVIGAKMIPLAYVICNDPQVPGLAPTLAPNQPHSTEHGSVEGELIARASHTHAHFRDDNSVVYYHLEEPEDVYILTPTTWNPHSDAYVINEESMLDWEGNMKHEKDHEKRVVLEDIPTDDTMISSLTLCEKEQMAVSSYFVDQDEDINAAYGFEDEHQL